MEPIQNKETVSLKVVIAYCIATAVATAIGGAAASIVHSKLTGQEPVVCYAAEQVHKVFAPVPPGG